MQNANIVHARKSLMINICHEVSGDALAQSSFSGVVPLESSHRYTNYFATQSFIYGKVYCNA